MTGILDWRLDIDEEFQGWILIFVTLSAVWVLLCPYFMAGLPCGWVRHMANGIIRRMPLYYCLALIVDILFLFLVLTWLPDWTHDEYITLLLDFFALLLGRLLASISSIVIIGLFCVAFAFRSRILLLLGIDPKRFIKFRFTDLFGSPTYESIELQIWKVEDLASEDPFNANNVYVETMLGFNEKHCSRVHNGAGSHCVLRERFQLNFDEGEVEDEMLINVRTQKIINSLRIARLELTVSDINELKVKSLELHRETGGPPQWDEESFICRTLKPRGKIWLRIIPVEEDDNRLFVRMTRC